MKNLRPQIKKAAKEFYAEMAAEDARYSRNGKYQSNQNEPKKRPVKNYTKAWSEHADDFDEVDDFYGR